MEYTTDERGSYLSSLVVQYVFDTSADVLAALAVLVASVIVVSYGSNWQAVVGAPLVLFVPGYAVLLFLYPATDASIQRSTADANGNVPDVGGYLPVKALGNGERVLLSFGVSVAAMPLVGIGLAAIGLMGRHGLLVAYVTLSLCLLVLGDARRRRVPDDHRYAPSFRSQFAEARQAIDGPSGWTSALLNVALVVTVLSTSVGLGYALIAPNHGASYTNFSLLTRQNDGSFVASGYPTNLSSGQPSTLYVEIDNHESALTNYSVVVELQRLRTTGNRTTVTKREILGHVTQTVGAGNSWRDQVSFTPRMTGSELRLAFFLYKGETPATPSSSSAYRALYLWVDVSGSSTENFSAVRYPPRRAPAAST